MCSLSACLCSRRTIPVSINVNLFRVEYTKIEVEKERTHVLGDCVDETTVWHVHIEPLNDLVERVAWWQFVQELHVQTLHFLVNYGAKGTKSEASLGRYHFDAHVLVARGSHAVQQRGQQ